MPSYGRWIGCLVAYGSIWAASEYISLQAGLLCLTAAVGATFIEIHERLDRISKALEMQSKRVFPEHWDNDD